MGVNYLWDTNTVIYYLQQQLSNEAEMFVTKNFTGIAAIYLCNY